MADEYIRKADAIKQCGFGMTSLHIADNLRKMRPADVAPVVHGRWENYSPITIKCSRCGHVIHDWRYSECKYCPNCGAKMDAQGEE